MTTAWERRLAAAAHRAGLMSSDDLQAMIPAGLLADDRDATFALLRLASGRDRFGTTLRALADDGEVVIVEITKDDSSLNVSTIIERHLTEDALTGLPGRELVLDRLALALGGAARSANLVGVLWLDLDHYRQVNAEYGAAVADEALADVARCLAAALRPGDTLARMGSDEFVVIGVDIESSSGARALGERLRRAVTAATAVSDRSIALTASVGVVVGGPGDAPDELLATAERAAMAAKENGRNRCELYDDELRAVVERTQRADREVRALLESVDLSLEFEPVCSLSSGAVELLRVTASLPGVADLLALTATPALAQRIVLSVIDRAVVEITEAHLSHLKPSLLVPIPCEVLSGDELARRLIETLASRSFDPSRLVLSLPDRVLSEHRPNTTATVERLALRGVGFALTGFTGGSVARERIRDSRFGFVELDARLVAELAVSPADRVMAGPAGQAVGDDRQIMAAAIDTRAALTDARIAGCHLARGAALHAPVQRLDELLGACTES